MFDQPGLGARGCMVWEEARWNRGLLAHHRALIDLRKRSPALARGGFQLLLVEGDSVAFLRESLEERIVVLAHRADAPRPAGPLAVWPGGVADGTRFVEVFSGEAFVVREGALWLPAVGQGAVVLRQAGAAAGGGA